MPEEWREKYKMQNKYDAENVVRTNIKLNKKTDADILPTHPLSLPLQWAKHWPDRLPPPFLQTQ